MPSSMETVQHKWSDGLWKTSYFKTKLSSLFFFTFYPTGRQYSKVCGRVIAYQFCSPGAFNIPHLNPQPHSIDENYVEGVSITHGQPRSHIWTLAAGVTEGTYRSGPGPDCPCS